tara:strand:- start:3161 stop:3490 length:330 start_codon:yes stop_codon:yes gene_type:complete
VKADAGLAVEGPATLAEDRVHAVLFEFGNDLRHMIDPNDDGDPNEADFDFEAECIRVYRDAQTDDVKIKALSLIAKVRPSPPPVKPENVPGVRQPAALAAQRKMNGGSE